MGMGDEHHFLYGALENAILIYVIVRDWKMSFLYVGAVKVTSLCK